MQSLVASNFNKIYNPSGRQNALSDIKRLLTSRDTSIQNKACGYLIEVINRCKESSNERICMMEYLLDNDITVFLCEATCNLDFQLFKSVLQCLRWLWQCRRFFIEEHAAQATTAVLRALAHYANSSVHGAINACLHFLCDLFNRISTEETTSPLSSQSAYTIEQLLACLNTLSSRINTNPNNVLSCALVLHALLSYQPEDLNIRSCTAVALTEVLNRWNQLLLAALNHTVLINDDCTVGMIFMVTCQLGLDILRLLKLLQYGKTKTDFVQTILTDKQEINTLKQCASDFKNSIRKVISELTEFVKDNHRQIATEEYNVFLMFLLNFIYDTAKTDLIDDFCDELFSKGYLTILPQVQIKRNDHSVRRISTLVLGEMLKVLAKKYLNVIDSTSCNDPKARQELIAKDIHLGLAELQYGIEKPQNIGIQLQKSQPYSLIIYIYFYCQSSENPGEATSPLLLYLMEYILRLPYTCKLPSYIIKALWLVFSMSTISNGSLNSLEERIYLEKATDRFVVMLNPEPSIYYTHNPAILLWSFTSQRIPNFIRVQVLSQWLKTENYLPVELTCEPMIWELLLNILIQGNNKDIVQNCLNALNVCLEEVSDESQQNFAAMMWSLLPETLSRTLINCNIETETNICYLLDLATTFLPLELDQTLCLKIAVLIATLFSKNNPELSNTDVVESRYHYEYVCLKLCLYLLGLANNQQDNRVLHTYINRVAFMPSVLRTSFSSDDRVACAALQLLSYIVHYFNKNNFQPKTILQIQTNVIIKSLRDDSASERGASLLQLVYLVLNAGINTPLALSSDLEVEPPVTQQYRALRTLMFRIQMLCCRENKNQSSAGWKTLASIFRHAITCKNDSKLVAALTSQPWTHTLIHFQLTQNITQEFLLFTQNWLSLLKITIKKSQEDKKSKLSKYSLINTTLMRLKKNLVLEKEANLKDLKQNILIIVEHILDEYSVV